MYFCPHLARKWVIPNSGRDCHAWMKRIFASIRLIWATFWWASRIRAEIWQTRHCQVSTGPEVITDFTYSNKKKLGTPASSLFTVTYTGTTANTARHQKRTKTKSSSPWPIINVSWDFYSNPLKTSSYFANRQTNKQTPTMSLPPPLVEANTANKLLFYNHPSQ